MFLQVLNNECVPCDGPCPKACKGVPVVHDGNIALFKDCTIIEGSLSILDSTFMGFQHVYENFTIGPKIAPMAPEKLEVFNTVKEITGYFNVQGDHENFTSLSYFRYLVILRISFIDNNAIIARLLLLNHVIGIWK